MVKAALRGTTRFETTRLAAAIFWAALIAAAVIVAARLVAASFAALRRSILRGRQVAASYGWALRASTAMASATATPASTTATVAATVTTTIAAAAEILSAAIAATARAWRIILSGIVMGREILRGRGVRIRLALIGVMSIVVHFGGVGPERFVGSGVIFYRAGLLVVRVGIVLRRFVL
jgi:hypothetical protein